MNRIIIKDNEDRIIINIDNNKIYGLRFKKDNSVEKINNVLSYFDFLKLSDDNKELYDLDGYKVFMDNKTMIKHYFKDGKESLEMLYKNNGINYVFTNDKPNLAGVKKFCINAAKSAFVIASLSSLLNVASIQAYANQNKSIFEPINVSSASFDISDADLATELGISQKEITMDDLKNKIYGSSNLSEEEKQLLFNENLFNDVLPIINESSYLKYFYNYRFDNIDIDCFPKEMEERFNDGVVGYYQPDEFNKIHVRGYEENIKDNEYVIGHEFIHLCQDSSQSLFFCESCAELIGSEYFNYSLTSYKEEIKVLEKLMEVVGPEMVFEYTFSGDFSKIDAELRQYLDDTDYYAYLFAIDDYYAFSPYYAVDLLNELTEKLYENKYNQKAEDNIVFKAIDSDTMQRYYFNKELTNGESYFVDKNYGDELNYSLDEACKEGLVSISVYVRTYYTQEEAELLKAQGENVFETFESNNTPGLVLQSSILKNGEYYLNGSLDGVEFKDVPLSELRAKGYIKTSYVKDEKLSLSYDDFVYHNYPDNGSITYRPIEGFVIRDGRVIGHKATKVELPPVASESVRTR